MRTTSFGFLALLLLPLTANGETLATVGSKTITRAAVEDAMSSELDQLERQRYELLRSGLDNLVVNELLAQEATAQSVTIEQLYQVEVIDKAGAPTDAEMQKLYDDHKAELGGQSFDDVKSQLVEYLTEQRQQTRARAFIGELKKKYPTKIMLRPKTVEVGLGSRPPLGPADAPITIVEFSDYECPFCKKAEPTVKKVLEVYGDKIRLAYRDFPLAFHASARPAAEAAHCAAEQGKFWEYHVKLMAAPDLSADQLTAIAKATGVDEKKFADCVASKRFSAKIDEDVAAASAAGVSGTPAFFINGRLLEGAQPFEEFQQIIDEELEIAASQN